MSTLSIAPSTHRDDAVTHAARYIANASLLGSPDFQVTAWLHATPALSARSAGYLAATLADRHVRDALLVAAVGGDDDVVNAVAAGSGPAGAIKAALTTHCASPTATRVRTVLDVVAEQTHDAPALACEALAASAVLAWLSGDAQRARQTALTAVHLNADNRLARLILQAAHLLPTPRPAAADNTPPASARPTGPGTSVTD